MLKMGNFSLITFPPYNLPFVSFQRIRKKNFTLFSVTVTSLDFRFFSSFAFSWANFYVGDYVSSLITAFHFCTHENSSFSHFYFSSSLTAAELNEMNALIRCCCWTLHFPCWWRNPFITFSFLYFPFHRRLTITTAVLIYVVMFTSLDELKRQKKARSLVNKSLNVKSEAGNFPLSSYAFIFFMFTEKLKEIHDDGSLFVLKHIFYPKYIMKTMKDIPTGGESIKHIQLFYNISLLRIFIFQGLQFPRISFFLFSFFFHPHNILCSETVKSLPDKVRSL